MKTSRLALAVFTAGLLCDGNAVGQDEQKAESDAAVVRFENTLAEAKAGDVESMFLLGFMYDHGQGVIENDKEAVKWWRKAAELGHAQAMYFLGSMYDLGHGVIEDDVEAYAWLNMVAAKGLKRAAESRDKRKKAMTSEQIAEGQKRSREIMKAIAKE